MAKSWKEVIASDKYLSLTPEQKTQAQDQYFNEVVAPQLQGSDIEVAKEQFYTAYPVKDDYSSTEALSSVIAPAEILASMGTGMAADAVGGISGLIAGALPGERGQAEDTLRWVQDTFTYQPRTRAAQDIMQGLQPVGEFFQEIEQAAGDVGFESTGSPLVGSLTSTIPAAIAEIPIFKGPKALARASKIRQAKKIDEAEGFKQQADDLTAQPEAVSQALDGTEADIQVAADVDPEFYRAADELNLDTEPLASYASQNPQYRGVEQGLAAIPESALNAQGKAFVANLSQKADNLIEQYGGTTDKGALSDEFRADSLATVEDLANQADALYDKLDMAIPKNTRVSADNSIRLLDDVIEEYGGDIRKIPSAYKKLSKLRPKTKQSKGPVNPATGSRELRTETDLPTFSQVDQLRREIGQAINKRSGPFKDVESGTLKRIYANLRKDQDLIAEQQGVSDISNSANALVRQRKQIEDNLVKLLGKDFSKDVSVGAGRAIKGLTKGELSKWDNMISKLPKESRQRVVATALNDIFAGSGSNQKAFSTNNFTKFYEDLNRNKAAKTRLFKELPKQARIDLDNLYKISKGVDTALKDKIPTGMVSRFFEPNNGFMRKLLGKSAGMLATAKGGVLAGDIITEVLSGSGNRAKSTSDMLASPKFQQIIRQAVSEGVQEGSKKSKILDKAEKSFMQSKQYKKWADKLEPSDKQILASQGIISYLFTEDEE